MTVKGAVIWDFDGTLARRRPGAWSACSIEILDRHEPGHGIPLEAIRPFFQAGFPWHSPAVAHPELCDAGMWWGHVGRVIARAYEGVGIRPGRAADLAMLFRDRYLDAQCWELFDDAMTALAGARELGWRNVVLSNHVPELATIVGELGLRSEIDAVVNSAVTGFEKPHPEAYRLARHAAGDLTIAWMVGDNYEADVGGAEAQGIRAILVRCSDARATLHADGLADAVAIIEGSTR
ncbi:MAG: HAD family hydrolase [Candidatus Limnocylindria bacterium]